MTARLYVVPPKLPLGARISRSLTTKFNARTVFAEHVTKGRRAENDNGPQPRPWLCYTQVRRDGLRLLSRLVGVVRTLEAESRPSALDVQGCHALCCDCSACLNGGTVA